MNKTFFAGLAGALVVLAIAGALAAYAGNALTTGDVNCDGGVDAVDATLILQFEVGVLASLPCLESADTNHDGSFDALDAVLILQVDAGLLPFLPPAPTATATSTHVVPPTPPRTPTPTPTRTRTPTPRATVTATPTRSPTPHSALQPGEVIELARQWMSSDDAYFPYAVFDPQSMSCAASWNGTLWRVSCTGHFDFCSSSCEYYPFAMCVFEATRIVVGEDRC